MCTFQRRLRGLVLGVLLATSASLARASISDALIVYNPSSVGGVFASVIVDEATEIPGHLYYLDIPGSADPTKINHGTALIEPGGAFPTDLGDSSTGGPYSDFFGVTNIGTTEVPRFRLA